MSINTHSLFERKFSIPCSKVAVLNLPRLVERLENGLSKKVTLVCAPAGYGKTTLVANWARLGKAEIRWVNLDAGDNEQDILSAWRPAGDFEQSSLTLQDQCCFL